jgi:glucose-6-phosphate 1-dehydrogenase
MTGPRADGLVLFGITGDLARKMLLPALYALTKNGGVNVPVVGVALTDMDRDALQKHAHASIEAAVGTVDEAVFARLAARLDLVAGDYNDPGTFQRLKEKVADKGFLAHYLAVPPALFAIVARALGEIGLNTNARLVVEKPFGHDYASAQALNNDLHKWFPEQRLYRVDHFLGKEPIEELLVFRFANLVLEPIWNRNYVASIQITMAESFGVEDRGSFYDAVGALRDVVQNHLLQLLSYVTMEPPVSTEADALRDEKVKLLRAVVTPTADDLVRGQYDGYLQTPGVRPDSTTETFAALRLDIDNWRWADVPVLIRTGKHLAKTELEVIVEMRQPPTILFIHPLGQRPQSNVIRFHLQPDWGLTFQLLAKKPGEYDETRDISVGVDFAATMGKVPGAYERILTDAIDGDTRHFARQDTVMESWRIIEPLLDLTSRPLPYPEGSWGPAEADPLPPDGFWLPLAEPTDAS